MSAETPLWFDATYYAEQKLDQMSLIKWDGKTGWTYSAYLDELAKYDVTPYENFVASNEVHNLRLTNLSPNPLFNVNEYLTALADYANRTNYSYPGYKAGEWTAQKAMEHMFNDYHVSAWDHFTLAGQYNLINPSNDFDITAYYDELTAWRNSYVDPKTGAKGWEGRTDWTRLDVIEDNIWNETNPIEGLFGEAAGSGIRPQAVAASQRVTVDSDWNPWVEVETSTPVTPTRPGGSSSSGSGHGSGSGSGGSSSGSDDADDDAWLPDGAV
ncbi:MAG: hypothetical protein HDQ44_04175, partial [Desulfovibrio sp.]|nr:hypothetical protein [Desulfovibrio sp.]